MSLSIILMIVMMSAGIFLGSFIIGSLLVEKKKHSDYKKRVDQLSFRTNKDVSLEQFIDKVTQYVDTYIFKGKNNPKDSRLNVKLKMIGWDKYFEAQQWRAVKVATLMLGGVIAVLFGLISPPFGLVVGGIIAIMPDLLFKNEVKEKRDKLLAAFPDIIIIMQGYLEAGMTLVEAIVQTIPFANRAWMPVLKKMASDIELMGVEHALNELRDATDLQEVKEFASIVKVAYAQGDVGDSFKAQAERMYSIQEDRVLIKIGKRRNLAVVAQAPTMISVFILVGAPAIRQVIDMTKNM